jgi:hypothetical protein
MTRCLYSRRRTWTLDHSFGFGFLGRRRRRKEHSFHTPSWRDFSFGDPASASPFSFRSMTPGLVLGGDGFEPSWEMRRIVQALIVNGRDSLGIYTWTSGQDGATSENWVDGDQRVIRGWSECDQRVIRGWSEGDQRVSGQRPTPDQKVLLRFVALHSRSGHLAHDSQKSWYSEIVVLRNRGLQKS